MQTRGRMRCAECAKWTHAIRVSKQILDECFLKGIYLRKLRTRRRVSCLRKSSSSRPRDLGNIRGETAMSPRPAYHELHWIHALEYLFGIHISDTGQFFYASMNPAFERSLGISIERHQKKAIRDCMSEEDAKSVCVFCDACLAEGRPVRFRQRLTPGGRRR